MLRGGLTFSPYLKNPRYPLAKPPER
jgi:hypothetical protein